MSIIFAGGFFLQGCVTSKDPYRKTVRQLQRGKIREDTSYVYSIPYEKGSAHLIVQGYFGSFSHKKRAALDFKMKQGTKILAAREGVVIRMEEKNDKGGINKKYRQFANFIVIAHPDGSRSGYWHLKKDGVLVNTGDTVKQGQVIGLSGKTGYASTAHLHFLVWKSSGGTWQSIPTRFMTKDGPKYLRPWRKWRSV
ncbi:MAG: M23 family metallopeptidase [Chitinophagaceae bacterium]